MSYEVLILGLDRCGASIGMALRRAQGEVRRIGFDPEKRIARKAQELDAVDTLVPHPRGAIKTADLIIFSLPPAEVEVYLENLGGTIKEGAVVLDTGPIKRAFFDCAQRHLPRGRHYVGATPIIGPEALLRDSSGTDVPREDLFQGGSMAIIAPPGASEDTLDVAVNLAELLGAAPLFMDLSEHDSALAGAEDLPAFLGAALVHAASDSASWPEVQRLAGNNFAQAVSLCGLLEPAALTKHWAMNREHLLAKMDALIGELQRLRQLLAQEGQEEAVEDYLEQADRSRHDWIAARERADWSGEGRGATPARDAGFLGRLFGFRSREPRSKN